jgi:hypothetical protein
LRTFINLHAPMGTAVRMPEAYASYPLLSKPGGVGDGARETGFPGAVVEKAKGQGRGSSAGMAPPASGQLYAEGPRALTVPWTRRPFESSWSAGDSSSDPWPTTNARTRLNAAPRSRRVGSRCPQSGHDLERPPAVSGPRSRVLRRLPDEASRPRRGRPDFRGMVRAPSSMAPKSRIVQPSEYRASPNQPPRSTVC